MFRRRLPSVCVVALALIAPALRAQSASASVTIVPTAQCRGTACTVQLIFRTPAAAVATVRAGGLVSRVQVRRGTSRRLVHARGVRARFLVGVRFAGRSARRVVRRRAMPVNSTARSCALLRATGASLSVGPTSALTRSYTIHSTGTVRIAVIFVDFSDAPGVQTPSSIVSGWMAAGLRWLRTSSYGRVSVRLSPRGTTWLRMPKPSTAYGMADSVTYDEHHDYIADALALADPVMDFSAVDGIYVVAPSTAAIPISPTFGGVKGTFMADGRPLGPAVTFGTDVYTWGRTIVPHETGHMFGLPDLYGYVGDQHRFVGMWDLMGDVFEPTDLTAWQRRKLNWLSAGQILCATPTGSSWAMLTPLGSRGGVKAMFIRTGRYTGLVVENRQRVGNDRRICRVGALVYTLDSRVGSGRGPIRVVGGDPVGFGCGYGPRSDAILSRGQSVRRGRVTVRVLGAQSGRIEVAVSRR